MNGQEDEGSVAFERHAPQPAEADLADAAAGFQPADGAHAAIDEGLPELPL